MNSPLPIRLMLLPGLLMQRGPRAYYGGMLLVGLMTLAASVVWLVAPIALWSGFGHNWMLLWLVPTCAAIFVTALTPLPGGG